MDNKHIFDNKKSGAKKFTYIIIALLCIGAIAALGFMSYKSMQKPTQNNNTEITNPVDVPKTDEPKQTVDTTEKTEIEPKPEQQPSAQVKSKAYIMPVEAKEITANFSLTNPIYSKTLGDWRIHDGVDIAADLNTQVVASNDGVVENILHHDLMGVTVVIKHADGKKTTYSNLDDSVELEEGQIINQGDIVGKVGNTAVFEIADGPHLHFEMSDNGSKINPLDIIQK